MILGSGIGHKLLWNATLIERPFRLNRNGGSTSLFDAFSSREPEPTSLENALEHDDRTDRLALVHQIETLVDLLQFENVGNHRINLDLAVHVPVDDFRHVGPAPRAAERGALPDPAGDQLERPCRDFLAGFRHADHDRYAPAAVAGFQRLTHHSGIASAVEGEIRATIGQRHQMLDDIAVDLLGIDEMGHAEASAPLLLGIVEIDADDLVGAHHPRALDHIEANAAETEHHHIGARRDLGGVDHRPNPGSRAAADVAALVERRVLANLGHRNFRQHGEIREGRAAHIVEDRLALVAEARGAVGHQAFALRGADRGAEVGLLAEAAFALAAFGRVERDHMVAGLDRGNARAHFPDNAGALMAEDRGEDSLAVQAIQRIGVGVADSRRLDLDEDFASLWTIQVELDDLKRLLRFERDCGACLHLILLLRSSTLQSMFSPALRSVPASRPHHLIPVQLASAALAASGLSSCLGGRPPGMASLARARR